MNIEKTTGNKPPLAKKNPMYVYQKMRVIGVAFWMTGCLRLYKDGDAFGVVFRPWHPVTWALLVLAIPPCALSSSHLLEVVPLKLNSFWRKNKAQLQFATPWSRLDSFKDFDFSATVK